MLHYPLLELRFQVFFCLFLGDSAEPFFNRCVLVIVSRDRTPAVCSELMRVT